MVTKSPTTTISEYASFGNELNLKALISRECRRVCCVLTVLFLLWPREKRIIKSRYFWVPQVSYISCLFTHFFCHHHNLFVYNFLFCSVFRYIDFTERTLLL